MKINVFIWFFVFSSDASFSGNWNGTESVKKCDFLWGLRYDLFSLYLLFYYIAFEKIWVTKLETKAEGCCSLGLGFGTSSDLVIGKNLAAHKLCVFAGICFETQYVWYAVN